MHRGQAALERLASAMSSASGRATRHALTHASWLTQVEIYYSIVQRKVLMPNGLPNLDVLAERLLKFQYYWN